MFDFIFWKILKLFFFFFFSGNQGKPPRIKDSFNDFFFLICVKSVKSVNTTSLTSYKFLSKVNRSSFFFSFNVLFMFLHVQETLVIPPLIL